MSKLFFKRDEYKQLYCKITHNISKYLNLLIQMLNAAVPRLWGACNTSWLMSSTPPPTTVSATVSM